MSANDPDIPRGPSPADGGGDGQRDKLIQYVLIPYGINAISLFYVFQAGGNIPLPLLIPLGLLNLGAFGMATYTMATGRYPDER